MPKLLYELSPFALMAVLLSYWSIYLVYPGVGLDASWEISINMALQQNLIFGKDYVFTYGPLGYLATGIAEGVSRVYILLFKGYLVLNGIIFIFLLERLDLERSQRQILYVLLIFLFLFNFRYPEILILAFFVFSVWIYLRDEGFLSLFNAALIAAISLYIKVNTGILVNILYCLLVLYTLLFGTSRPRPILFSLIFFCALHLGLYATLPVELTGYLKYSIELINFYNDSMFSYPEQLSLYLGISYLIVAILLLYTHRTSLKMNKEIFLKFMLTVFLFVSFKQGFVRADSEHVHAFFFATSLILLFYLVEIGDIGYRRNVLFVISALTIIITLSGLIRPTRPEQTIRSFFSYEKRMGRHKEKMKQAASLPFEFTDRIGDLSADIMPYDISLIYYNNLNYKPRPVIQSYSAYSSSLEKLNYSFYTSTSGPEFVIYNGTNSIDLQNPLWNDGRAHIALIQCYELIERSGHYLLFQRSKHPRKLSKVFIKEGLIGIGEELLIPESKDILVMEASVEYTMLGYLRRTVFQPSPLRITLKAPEKSKTFKAVLPVLESGIIINRDISVDNSSPATKFYQTDIQKMILFHSEKFISDFKKIEFSGDQNFFNAVIYYRFTAYQFE